MNQQSELRPPTLAENLAIEGYKTAITTALASVNGVCDKIVTAAFSVATAFGAVVALVAPKESPAPLLMALPFLLFAAAVALALYAQSIAVAPIARNTVEDAESSVKTAVDDKQWLARAAIILLVAGMASAAWVIYKTYRPSTESASDATLWLSPPGTKLVAQACGTRNATQLQGKVEDFSAKPVEVEVDESACPSGAGTLLLPRTAIAVARK